MSNRTPPVRNERGVNNQDWLRQETPKQLFLPEPCVITPTDFDIIVLHTFVVKTKNEIE
jgi:hypothetical protein